VRLVSDEEPALKVLDCSTDLPDDPFEALDRATWIPIARALKMDVLNR
jgi:hypothetical protein